MKRAAITLLAAGLITSGACSGASAQDALLLTGARVLDADGERLLEGRAVLVADGRIRRVGPANSLRAPAGAQTLDLSGLTLIPGLIDLHSHLLLHPYDERSWNEQVLSESLGLRTARAVVAAERTLLAGFTTIRDLGTEGAGYADVGVRDAINQGVIPGPRVLAATRALVATGAYGPSGFDPRWKMPVGAQVADGPVGARKATREQIAAGADWIKVYADYRRRPGDASTPTFTEEELAAIVHEATSAGLPVAAHASTDEAIRRAVLAGVKTIEHGYDASEASLRLMRDKGVVLCPTLAASEAMALYSGWTWESGRDHQRIAASRSLVERAMRAGVTIACGSDVGVFDHGDNARELELMVMYGVSPAAALKSATSVAAETIGRGEDLGKVAPGYIADLVAVRGDPLTDIASLRATGGVVVVIQSGSVVKDGR